jgi:hypothetical protein
MEGSIKTRSLFCVGRFIVGSKLASRAVFGNKLSVKGSKNMHLPVQGPGVSKALMQSGHTVILPESVVKVWHDPGKTHEGLWLVEVSLGPIFLMWFWYCRPPEQRLSRQAVCDNAWNESENDFDMVIRLK